MSQITEKKVAIIGLGSIGRVLATNLVNGNRSVIVAARDFSKARDLSETLGNLATPLEITAAIQQADIIVPAIWYASIAGFLEQYSLLLEGKTIVDPSNPIVPNATGGFDKMIGELESAGQINASLLPTGARLAKAFGTLGAASLAALSGQRPEPAVLFYATDDQTIDPVIEELIIDAGFDPLRVGGLDQSITLEVFGELHEFGALGKTVSLSDAKRLI